MTDHTTHFDDCGCKSARLEAEVARLTKECDEAKAELLGIKEVHYENGSLDLAFSGETVRVLAANLVHWFKESGGVNYVQCECADPSDGRRYELTMRPLSGKLASAVAAEASARCDALAAAAQALVTPLSTALAGDNTTTTREAVAEAYRALRDMLEHPLDKAADQSIPFAEVEHMVREAALAGIGDDQNMPLDPRAKREIAEAIAERVLKGGGR